MRTKQLFLIFALLCTMVQGAWAQASWDEVYAMTNTTSANWTKLNAGSSTGKTLGTAGTTTYYYADASLTFSNSTAGGSGLTILGNVYLYLPQGVTVTCTGANAEGTTGAGAGIELTSDNTLYLIGSGTLNATGGNAANGGNGGNGSDADWDNNNDWSGTGGTGGHGGGGAGAGIGTRGGQGGNGGAGAASVTSAWSTAGGGSGAAGQAGATAGGMGELYVAQSLGMTATGGAAASQGGSAGGAGKSAFYDGTGYNYTAAGGGGGGGGGFGGAASNIGTGGPGGGGGGGGASGNLDWSTEPGYYVVKAPGGKGGQNADGTWAAAGAESIMNHHAIKSGQVKINVSGWEDDQYNYDNYTSSQAVGTGGSGNTAGSASTSEQAVTFNLKMPAQGEWDMVCQQTKTSQSQWIALPLGAPKGATLGTADATTYYFAMGDCTFTNSNAGGSGLTILGTVHLFIASGQTITCTGADATAPTGGGAGVELTEGNTLCLIGSGKIVATGGQAANGCNGFKGGDAAYKVAKNIYDSNGIKSGDGGRGGDGGGGAGAGIGTRGADGGAGGAGGVGKQEFDEVTGNVGSTGANGGTAADMGTLYVYQMAEPAIEAHGGSSGTSGSGGAAGLNAVFRPYDKSATIIIIPAPRKEIHDGSSGTSSSGAPRRSDDYSRGNVYSVGGGGGGGAGGFGGAASDIGTGGPGGGGGGGGASGTITYKDVSTGVAYYQVGAFGGKGGANADGTAAADGEETMINSEKTNVVFDEESYKGYTFLGWYNGIDIRAAGGEGANPGAAAQSGTYDVIAAVITLADNADNSTTISDAHGYLADVTLSGRTLYKDGDWNTLCLPFDVTIAGSPLEGATVKELDTEGTYDTDKKTGYDTTSGTLYLYFKVATKIVAGKPYLVKWDATTPDNFENPVFNSVTIDNTASTTVTASNTGLNTVQFIGNYSPVTLTGLDASNYYLGTGSKLYWPSQDRTMNSFRAYFHVDLGGNANVKAFVLNLDDTTTGISLTPGPSPKGEGSEYWYDLSGRKLSGKPTQKGIYIVNGKKVVIK